MEAKTKAKYLVEKFEPAAFEFTQLRAYQNAKQCALLCVDEIISELEQLRKPEYTTFITDYEKQETMDGYEKTEYWLSVKKEIQNL